MSFGEILMYSVSFFGIFTSLYFLITLIENRNNLTNPKSKKKPTVTVIVPAYNEEHTIEKTIRSLLNLDYPKDKLDIIVVDDGSTDNTFKVAKKFASDQLIVIRKKNGGKATAMNLGIKMSTTDFIGCLDADSFVAPDALKKMVGYFNNKKVTAVTPSLKVHNAKTVLQKVQMIEYLIGVFLRKSFSLLGSIHVTPGPFTIYRKEFFKKYGGFDENNLTEDIEIALRIQSKNHMIENAMNASVYTVAPDNWNDLMKQRLRWYMGFIDNVAKYTRLFGKKHGNLGILIMPASLLSVALVVTMLLYVIFITTSNALKSLINMYNIDFDIWAMFSPNTDLFYLNFSTLAFIGIISISLGITIIWIAKKISEEDTSIKFPYLLFLSIYWIIFGYWWLLSIIYKILGKKVGWGHKSVKSTEPKRPKIV